MPDKLEQIIRQIVDFLKESGAEEVYVFGSSATGNFRDDSDIDIAVKGLPAGNFFKLSGKLWSLAGRPVDIVNLDRPNRFTKLIMESKELRRVG